MVTNDKNKSARCIYETKELEYHAVRGKMYMLRSWIYGAGSSLSYQAQAFSGGKPNKPEECNPT